MELINMLTLSILGTILILTILSYNAIKENAKEHTRLQNEVRSNEKKQAVEQKQLQTVAKINREKEQKMLEDQMSQFSAILTEVREQQKVYPTYDWLNAQIQEILLRVKTKADFITFAAGTHYEECATTHLKWMKEEAEHKGFQMSLRCYTPTDMDADFYTRNHDILSQPRGFGYWIWKPYFIRKALAEAVEGGIVIYSDVCSKACDIRMLYDTAMTYDIAGIQLQNTQVRWTKADAFVLMKAEDQLSDQRLLQRAATILAFKNCERVRRFVDQWLTYCEDARIVTDQPNEMGVPNHTDFTEHRHDQSVFSILTYQRNMGLFLSVSYMDQHAFG
jgi:hypothetical protein